MQTLVDGCPDYIACRLEVSAPKVAMLRPFLAAAAGPGFIDWNPNWWDAYERGYWQIRAAGQSVGREGPLPAAAGALALHLRDRAWKLHEVERDRAAADPTRIPLDLSSLIPIPQSVIDAGYYPAGEQWMTTHWGTPAPLRQVRFAMEQRGFVNDDIRQFAAFKFIAESWAPWIALKTIARNWPELTFSLRCSYD